MQRSSFGKTSLHALEPLTPSSRTTVFNLIVKPSEILLRLRDHEPIFHSYLPPRKWQAEAVNKVIVSGLKKRLDNAKGRWVEELPHVLWTYWTMPRRSTRETPLSMTYGAEAILPLEASFPTLKSSTFTPKNNDELLGRSLDLV